MNIAGEYPEPLPRTAPVQAPVMAGIKTVRLRTNGTLPQDNNDPQSSTQILVVNTGPNQVSLKLQESDDYTDGPFTDIGSELTIVPRGQETLTIFPKRKYLEMLGTTGTGEVKLQLTSQIRYTPLAFAKTDGSWNTGINKAEIPGWSTL